eukprot:5406546-Pleurochrysis_carterae.AAC.1
MMCVRPRACRQAPYAFADPFPIPLLRACNRKAHGSAAALLSGAVLGGGETYCEQRRPQGPYGTGPRYAARRKRSAGSALQRNLEILPEALRGARKCEASVLIRVTYHPCCAWHPFEGHRVLLCVFHCCTFKNRRRSASQLSIQVGAKLSFSTQKPAFCHHSSQLFVIRRCLSS